MKPFNPDDPAAPIDIISVWGRNKLHPELPPTPLEWVSQPGFSKRERAMLDIYVALLSTRKDISPESLKGLAGMASMATQYFIDEINGVKESALYPELSRREREEMTEKIVIELESHTR